MRYFYDLEFNDPGYGDIELISIGMVCEDGREYYAINESCDLDNVESNEWLRENVLPHLPTKMNKSIHVDREYLVWDFGSGVVKSLEEIVREVQEFMSVGLTAGLDKEAVERGVLRDSNELWAYYGAYDHVVMCRSLWGAMSDLPSCVPMWTHELMQLWENAGKPEKPLMEGNEHHALADARWNMRLYDTCTGAYNSMSG